MQKKKKEKKKKKKGIAGEGTETTLAVSCTGQCRSSKTLNS